MTEDCIFCKIAEGTLPSREVYSDDLIYAFHDINPATPTHILIIPRKHIPRIDAAEKADEALIGHMFLKANEIARAAGLDGSGFRLVINCGEDALQTVFHIHLHLLGGRAMTWPPG